MCGIAGFELTGDDERVARTLLRQLAPRGPDGAWFTSAGQFGLVQTRLAVIDLSDRVRYPLTNEAEDLFLLFNGEIYDYARHRKELQRRGHRFATECDAEVLLHGYEQWGGDVFARLDGMFAVALLHAPSGELVLARDLMGIKPLVYTNKNQFAFATDALSLVAAGLSEGEVDDEAIAQYLGLNYVPPPKTGISDVRDLEPGEILTRGPDGRIALDRWRARPFTQPIRPAQVTIEEVGDAVDTSVRQQLVADVPVGVLLSSGIDSSLVLDSAVRAGASPKAFTLAFGGHGDYDESSAAGRLARDLGVPHVQEDLSVGFVNAVELVTGAYDRPLADASAIPTLLIARLARRDVTVVMTGTGGDELFAGYYRHRAHLGYPLISRIPAALRRRLRGLSLSEGAERRSLAALATSYLVRLAAAPTDPLDQYLALVSTSSTAETFRSIPSPAATSLAHHVAATSEASSLLRRLQALELATYLPGDLLAKEDRATMSAGLEARVPLLSTALVDLAERVPDRQKASLLSGKLILRALARQRLPGYVSRSRKRGFAVPLACLFADLWRSEAMEWFADSTSSLVDTSLTNDLLRRGALPPTTAWKTAVLVGWEQAVRGARVSSQHV